MQPIYKSEGISKTTRTKKLISIIILTAISVSLLLLTLSKVDGQRTPISSMNGQISYVKTEKYRFDADERRTLTTASYVLLAFGVIEILSLALESRSWTEIYENEIKAYTNGKSVICKISEIRGLNDFGNKLIVTTNAGKKIILIVQKPLEAKNTIEQLL